jgi:hypothetical protein
VTAEVINGLIGLIVGLLSGFLSGFYFERRATTAAKAYSRELERDLDEIQHSVLSMGGSLPDSEPSGDGAELLDQVHRRALATQDPQGRVSTAALRTYFLAKGHAAGSIDQAVEELCAAGEAQEVDRWLMLR